VFAWEKPKVIFSLQNKFLPPFLRKNRPRRYMTIFYGNDEDLRGGGKNFNNFLVSPRRQDAKKSCFNRKLSYLHQTLCVFARENLNLPVAEAIADEN
jgi:sRNA-binding regulator protein Hfq